jgi:hypothetical protein
MQQSALVLINRGLISTYQQSALVRRCSLVLRAPDAHEADPTRPEQGELIQHLQATVTELERRALALPLAAAFSWTALLDPFASSAWGRRERSPAHSFGPGLEVSPGTLPFTCIYIYVINSHMHINLCYQQLGRGIPPPPPSPLVGPLPRSLLYRDAWRAARLTKSLSSVSRLKICPRGPDRARPAHPAPQGCVAAALEPERAVLPANGSNAVNDPNVLPALQLGFELQQGFRCLPPLHSEAVPFLEYPTGHPEAGQHTRRPKIAVAASSAHALCLSLSLSPSLSTTLLSLSLSLSLSITLLSRSHG